MATWDSADLLSRVRTYIHRPATDELATDTLLYSLLTEAQGEVLGMLAGLCPQSQMGAPVLLTSSDGGVTYTFGTDDNGHAIVPLACEVYASVDGRELTASSWEALGDFVIEGDRIRMPRNEPQTFDSGPYARFVRADQPISASSEPALKPAPARVMLVYLACTKFAAIGGLRDPDPWQELFDRSFKTWLTALRTQFQDATRPATEGVAYPAWWTTYGTR